MKKPKSLSLGNHLESFFRTYLVQQRSCSPSTISTYRDGLKLLLIFASEQIEKPPVKLSLREINRELVLKFLDYLESERGNSVSTRNARLAAIKSFFRHVAYNDPAAIGLAEQIIAIPIKRPLKRPVNYLRYDDLRTLLSIPDQNTWIGRRDYTLLLFLGRTGARVSEMTGLNSADLRLVKPYQVLLRGKGSKERVVPLTEETVTALRNYRDENINRLKSEGSFFINRKGERMTRFGVVHMINRTVKVAIDQHPNFTDMNISPHTFRHTVAMHMLQAGVDLTTIRSWLGHVTVNTTHLYVEADTEMKRRAIEMCLSPETPVSLYVPPDDVIALLENI